MSSNLPTIWYIMSFTCLYDNFYFNVYRTPCQLQINIFIQDFRILLKTWLTHFPSLKKFCQYSYKWDSMGLLERSHTQEVLPVWLCLRQMDWVYFDDILGQTKRNHLWHRTCKRILILYQRGQHNITVYPLIECRHYNSKIVKLSTVLCVLLYRYYALEDYLQEQY